MENKMKVSERTINLLKNYAHINQSLEFREGKFLKTVSPLNTILATVEIEEEFPRAVPLWDLNEFLGILSTYDDPELEFNDNSVKIIEKNDNEEYTEYRYSSSSMFQTPPEKEINFPTPEINFTLTNDVWKKVVDRTNVLGLPEIVVEGDGATIRIKTYDTGNLSSNLNNQKVGVTDKTFCMIFKTENLIKVMEGDYDISLSSKRISHFKREGDSLQYWIALEQNSTFDGE